MTESSVVRVVADDVVDVPEVEAVVGHRGERVAPQDRVVDEVAGQHGGKGWEQPTRPSDVEVAEADSSLGGTLLEEQRRDEEPREDEEEVDAVTAA